MAVQWLVAGTVITMAEADYLGVPIIKSPGEPEGDLKEGVVSRMTLPKES